MDLDAWAHRRGGIAHPRRRATAGTPATRSASARRGARIDASVAAGCATQPRSGPAALVLRHPAGGRLACVSASQPSRPVDHSTTDGSTRGPHRVTRGHSRRATPRCTGASGPIADQPVRARRAGRRTRSVHVADCQPVRSRARDMGVGAPRQVGVVGRAPRAAAAAERSRRRVRGPRATQLSDSGIESISGGAARAASASPCGSRSRSTGTAVDGLDRDTPRATRSTGTSSTVRAGAATARPRPGSATPAHGLHSSSASATTRVLAEWDSVELEIRLAVAQGLHLSRSDGAPHGAQESARVIRTRARRDRCVAYAMSSAARGARSRQARQSARRDAAQRERMPRGQARPPPRSSAAT